MKVYFANFQGYPLGGTAIVVAKDLHSAYMQIRCRMDQEGLGDSGLDMDDITLMKIKEEGIPYFDDGDY
jgi:hypothetical protein